MLRYPKITVESTDQAVPESRSSNDTIVAISTPPGRGGIGIVRLSGAQAVVIATALVRLRNPLVHAIARFAEVIDPERPESDDRLDEALATWFASPHSYTGEDLVEIAAHGSPVILDLLVRQSIARGARLAQPGEFTERAFLSGRMDLTQAEAVRDLIEANTLYQARVAAQQMGGALSRRISPVKQNLVTLIATLEAGIDFAEDDVDVMSGESILEKIDEVQRPLECIEASFAQGRIVHSGLTLAIVGRPNAGKSSLFNRMVERERAIVTATPGTTRDLVTERVSIGGIPLELIDTAGLRDSSDEVEAIGIQKTREAFADADIVLLVLDATQTLNSEEWSLLEALADRPALIALNKSDIANANVPVLMALDKSDLASANVPALIALNTCGLAHGNVHGISSTIDVVSTSALTGAGIVELREKILAVAGASGEPQSGLLTNLRQHCAVKETLNSLSAAQGAVANKTPHEMLLLDLYQGLRQLDLLTGHTTSDDVLNLIFSTFCIGK